MTMEREFRVGDVIMLKSGGPKMTVKSVGRDWVDTMCVFVTWFGDKNKVKDGAYPIETVELAIGHQTR